MNVAYPKPDRRLSTRIGQVDPKGYACFREAVGGTRTTAAGEYRRE